MNSPDKGSVTVFELYELGVNIERQNLRRRHPDASEEEIEALLRRWLLDRPGAPHGDGVGVPSRRFQ